MNRKNLERMNDVLDALPPSIAGVAWGPALARPWARLSDPSWVVL